MCKVLQRLWRSLQKYQLWDTGNLMSEMALCRTQVKVSFSEKKQKVKITDGLCTTDANDPLCWPGSGKSTCNSQTLWASSPIWWSPSCLSHCQCAGTAMAPSDDDATVKRTWAVLLHMFATSTSVVDSQRWRARPSMVKTSRSPTVLVKRGLWAWDKIHFQPQPHFYPHNSSDLTWLDIELYMSQKTS